MNNNDVRLSLVIGRYLHPHQFIYILTNIVIPALGTPKVSQKFFSECSI